MRSFAILFTVLCISACDQSPDISSEEIAQALRMKKWNVRMPANMPKGTIVAVVLRHANGEEIESGGMGGVAPNESIRVFLWPDQGDEVRYAIFQENGVMHSSIRNPFSGTSTVYPSDSKSEVTPGDFLKKSSETGSVSYSDTLQEGEFGFTVKVWTP